MAKSRKKDVYWHNVARLCIEYGFKPAQIAKVIKSIFPLAEVTGRHVGAYKRRLINDNMLEKNLPKTISPNEGFAMIEGLVGEDDRFIYNCAVGSAKRTLKCFEYKLTHEVIDHTEAIDMWLDVINGI